MPEYRLTLKAESDLRNIALYGIEQFGVERARRYRDRLKHRFAELAAYPQRYPLVPHIRAGYRRSVCGVHSIYYRLATDGVEIVRVLGRQDFIRALTDQEDDR